MPDSEYTEPTNKQLASFMAVHIGTQVNLEGIEVNPDILEYIFKTRPEYREKALETHRQFQEDLNDLNEKIQAGELRCEYIRTNGRRCPNFNQPGTPYCGFHQETIKDDGIQDSGVPNA